MSIERVIYLKKKKKKKKISELTGNEKSWFPKAYNYYYHIDLPGAMALKSFMRVMRTADEESTIRFLYESYLLNSEAIRRDFQKSTVRYREDIDTRVEYINRRMQLLTFGKENNDG